MENAIKSAGNPCLSSWQLPSDKCPTSHRFPHLNSRCPPDQVEPGVPPAPLEQVAQP